MKLTTIKNYQECLKKLVEFLGIKTFTHRLSRHKRIGCENLTYASSEFQNKYIKRIGGETIFKDIMSANLWK